TKLRIARKLFVSTKLVDHLESESEHIVSVIVLVAHLYDYFHRHADFQSVRVALFKHRGHANSFGQLDHPDAVRSKHFRSAVRRRRLVPLHGEAVQSSSTTQVNSLGRFFAALRTKRVCRKYYFSALATTTAQQIWAFVGPVEESLSRLNLFLFGFAHT